jgi:MFS family permease
VLQLPSSPSTSRTPAIQQFRKLDPLGTAVFLPSIVCLLLALQWGDTTYEWTSWRIVLLLSLFAVLFVVWLILQVVFPETATIPMRILLQRSIASACFFSFTSQGSMLVLSYYIPLFFQALKSYSPISSGLATLPMVLALVIGAILSGGMVQRLGYPAPFMIASAILSSIGAGLVSTWKIDVHRSKWIGYQVLLGFGVGIGMQQPSTMAQIVLDRKDAPTGVSLMFFSQNLGGAVFVSVAQNIFADNLAERLAKISGLDMDRSAVVQMGATKIRQMVPSQLLGAVLVAYRAALRNAFYVGVGLAAITILGTMGVEWRSVKEEERKAGIRKSEGGKGVEDEEKEVESEKM